MILPCISLHQPWASALFMIDKRLNRIKLHETRSWPAPAKLIGKRVAIHAAKKPIPADLDPRVRDCIKSWIGHFPMGAVIGTITLSSCTEMGSGAGFYVTAKFPGLPDNPSDAYFGDWEEGRFAWRMDQPKLLDEPIPWRGQQGWFSVEIPG